MARKLQRSETPGAVAPQPQRASARHPELKFGDGTEVGKSKAGTRSFPAKRCVIGMEIQCLYLGDEFLQISFHDFSERSVSEETGATM